ncbi:hypothetical protein B0H11DRAFT_2218162 [Mycena galericulata]|nr:hypothetical protein B0H11DRAFT_2218162 [Mycena galericulata]
MACKGKSGDGCSKSCSRFESRVGGEGDENSKCKNCPHQKKVHTKVVQAATLKDVLGKYNLDALGKKTPTDAEARAESSTGFRPNAGSSGSSKAATTKQKQNETGKQKIKVNSVHVITTGLDSRGELRIDKSPNAPALEQLRKNGLAAFTTLDGEDLTFNVNWTQERIDRWLRKTFSLLFQFLDLRYPENAAPKFHWMLVGKANRKLYIIGRPRITGAELNEAKGPTARNYLEHHIRIATKHKIPSSVLELGFQHAIEKLRSGENLLSESEVEEIASRPVRRKSQGVRVKREVTTKTISEVDADNSDSDFDELEDEVRDDPPAPRRRTRSSVVVKQEKTSESADTGKKLSLAALFLQGDDSDIEVVFPDRLIAQDNEGPSRKRSASLSFDSDPEDRATWKRSRSDSLGSDQSVTPSWYETSHDSPSPQLRPTTSSFQYDPALDPASATFGIGGPAYSTWTPTWTQTPPGGSSVSTASATASGSTTISAPSGTASLGTAALPIASLSSTSTQPSVGSSTGPSPIVNSSSAGPFTTTASSSSAPNPHTSTVSTVHTRRPALQIYVPPAPREGLVVPKPSHDPWA